MKHVIKLGLFFISVVFSISSVANQGAAATYGDNLFVECEKVADGTRYVVTYSEGGYFEGIPTVGVQCAFGIGNFLRANRNVRPFYVEEVAGTYHYWFLLEE